MASGFIKIATIIFILNIFMYLGVNFAVNAEGTSGLNNKYYFAFQGDMIEVFMGNSSTGQSAYTQLNNMVNDTKENWTSYNLDIEGDVMNIPQQESGEVTGTGGISIIDSLKVLWAIVPTMGNIVIAPLNLFFGFDMPIFIGLMLGIPYLFLLGLSFYALLGGRE